MNYEERIIFVQLCLAEFLTDGIIGERDSLSRVYKKLQAYRHNLKERAILDERLKKRKSKSKGL